MKLTEHTKFLFIAISSKQNEEVKDIDRFSTDLFHVIRVLESKGVDKANMEIVSDWDDANWANHNLGDINRILPNDACAHIQNIDCENLFIIVSCHGGPKGIGVNGLIRPHNLISAIKGNANIVNCISILGQCYAGVFNYTNVADQNKKIIYIGATGLRSGFSILRTWNQPPAVSWSANVLVYYLAEWLENPEDVDNDGVFSVMDMYKYATCYTNLLTNKAEIDLTSKYIEEKIRIEYSKQQNGGVLDKQLQLDHDANEELLAYIFLHQECWILNAVPASSLTIEF